MNQTESLANYLALRWTYTVETNQLSGFTMRVNELPEIVAHGESLDGAMAAMKLVLQSELQRRLKSGVAIPEPLAQEQCKGKIAYRTNSERHYKLAKEAKRRGMSLSRLIDYCIDEVV